MNSASTTEPASKRLQGSSLSSTPVSLSKSLHHIGSGHGRLQQRNRRRFRHRDVRSLQASLKSNDRTFTPDSSELASTVFRPTTPFEARKKFIHAGRMVIILSRIYKAVFKNTKNSDRQLEPSTFTSLAQEYESANLKLSGLSFDKNLFKAKKEVGVTPEVKNILCTPSYARTKEQLTTALIGLQTMKSFAEYPLHMQEKLVRVAWYEFIPPRRVIIRQGHYAENFYFIISGSVVVTILTKDDTGETSMRTAAVLRRGSSFGEIAILHHGLRTATVSSQGPVHLLCITREDFFDIFMRGQEPGQMPEHVTYIRQLNFMKYWPIEMLVEHPEMCLFHFYKRGQVIVKDSNKSDWLYIVKSGTCQVLMKLRAVKPLSHGGSRKGRERTEDDAQSTRFVSREQTEYDVNKRKRRSKTLSLPNIEPTKLSEPRKSLLKTTRSVSIHQLDLQSLADSPTFLTLSRPKATSGSDVDEDDRMSINTQNTQDTLNPLTVNVANQQGTSNDHQVTDQMTAADGREVSTGFLPDIESMRRGAGPCQTSFSPSTFRSFTASPKRAWRSNQHSRRDKKSKSVSPLAVRFDEVPDGRPASLPLDKDDLSVFIQVELLQPKDCFGLSSLDLDFGFDHAQSSVSLVSRGAECIMVNKDFFVKHASQAVKRNVRTLVYPYPTEEKLQQNLQSHSNWSHYKEETMHRLLGDQAKLRDLKT